MCDERHVFHVELRPRTALYGFASALTALHGLMAQHPSLSDPQVVLVREGMLFHVEHLGADIRHLDM